MLIRRHFLSLLGAAPVAAVTPAEPQPAECHMGKMTSASIDPLKEAEQRVAAIEWAARNDFQPLSEDVYFEEDPEVQSMKSWSNVAKHRISRERGMALYLAKREAYARKALQRQITLSFAPPWVKRFL